MFGFPRLEAIAIRFGFLKFREAAEQWNRVGRDVYIELIKSKTAEHPLSTVDCQHSPANMRHHWAAAAALLLRAGRTVGFVLCIGGRYEGTMG